MISYKWLAILVYFCILESSTSDSVTCELLPVRRNEENHVRCQGNLSEAETLRDALTNFTDSIHVFELYNSTLDLLPEDVFRDAKNASVRKVIFSKLSLNLLSVAEFQLPPFYSIENTLETFEVYDSSFVFAWNFSALSSMTRLRTVIIENSEFSTVPNTFKYWPGVRLIQLIKCNIWWVHEKAFRENENLTICSLSNNYINEIKRSMFPRRAVHLWSLDLSYNELKSLPKDVFIDMPKLRELKLDHNKLTRIGTDFIKRIWNNLTQLWLDGNDLICWSFCDIKKMRTESPLFFDSSYCVLPPKTEKTLGEFFQKSYC